jgi:hypothetical protein
MHMAGFRQPDIGDPLDLKEYAREEARERWVRRARVLLLAGDAFITDQL